MQVVDFIKEDSKDSLASWLILEAAVLKDELNGVDTETTVREITSKSPSEAIQVEFKVNGIELPFLETMATLKDQFNEQVQNAAKQLVKDKFHDIYMKLGTVEDTINHYVENNVKDYVWTPTN